MVLWCNNPTRWQRRRRRRRMCYVNNVDSHLSDFNIFICTLWALKDVSGMRFLKQNSAAFLVSFVCAKTEIIIFYIINTFLASNKEII
jgi:hypothetical protein